MGELEYEGFTVVYEVTEGESSVHGAWEDSYEDTGEIEILEVFNENGVELCTSDKNTWLTDNPEIYDLIG